MKKAVTVCSTAAVLSVLAAWAYLLAWLGYSALDWLAGFIKPWIE